MRREKAKSPSLFNLWTILGSLLGISIGMAINSMAIGVLAGISIGLVLGKADYRVRKSF